MLRNYLRIAFRNLGKYKFISFVNLQIGTTTGSLFTVFACIAIFIACLGLFGLASFAITQRIKEIGIRTT